MKKKLMCVTQNNQSTVVCDYTPVPREQKERQSEEQMEQKLISDLKNQGYEYIRLNNLEALKQNLRESLERLNDYKFTHNEWEDFYARVIKKPSSILEKAEIIQENWVHTLDCEDGRTKNIYLLKKDDIHANRLQVTHQHIASGEQGRCRYDVSLLVNGLPLVHIELKARGVSIREAFHQIDRYRFESFGGSDDGLFEYVQIFVISNGTLTRYYSNTTRQKSLNHNVRTVAKSTFEFTSHWADAKNRPIQEIEDFTKYFFSRHTLLNMLLRYCVFTSAKDLLVMRPYQIVATEKILDRIVYVHNAQEYGKNGSGGYIWHTTGSGKTLTSFKTAILATKLDYIHKVLFVVDRKDLDDQTVKEYEKFQKGSVSQTGSTRELKRRLEDHKDKSKIIVTTIQKLGRFIESNKDHSIFNEEVVLIFDECHRNHQGDMHRAIAKCFKKHYLFGFTGTPILNENNSRGLDMLTTEGVFGKKLHAYTICNAIQDNNVLRFRVSYHNVKSKTVRYHQCSDTTELEESREDTSTPQMRIHPKRIASIVDYILENFAHHTLRNKQNSKGFNSILACEGIPAVRAYYEEFKKRKSPLRIATIFSTVQNEEVNFTEVDEDNESTESLSVSDRNFLGQAILDYNAMFQTNYNVTTAFRDYYVNVSERTKNREIDILIVANMFLTGFDAPTLNTIWIDKNLKYHNLIQAFSRTNRILDSVKQFGNVVCFRDLEKDVNNALKLFSLDEESGQGYRVSIVEGYQKHLEEYTRLIQELKTNFNLLDEIIGEENQKRFIELFGKILRISSALKTFDEFENDELLTEAEEQDYLSKYLDQKDRIEARKKDSNTSPEELREYEEIEFETELIRQQEIDVSYILNLLSKFKGKEEKPDFTQDVERMIRANEDLRKREDILLDFMKIIDPDSSRSIPEQFSLYADRRAREDLDSIIQKHNLNGKFAWGFMERMFRNQRFSSDGDELPKMLPTGQGMGFGKNSRRSEVKKQVSSALEIFFNRYKGIWNPNQD